MMYGVHFGSYFIGRKTIKEARKRAMKEKIPYVHITYNLTGDWYGDVIYREGMFTWMTFSKGRYIQRLINSDGSLGKRIN